MPTPVIVPDLKTGGQPLRIGSWYVQPGESVEVGDRLVEFLTAGVTFEFASPSAGILAKHECGIDAVVQPGDVVGWISEA